MGVRLVPKAVCHNGCRDEHKIALEIILHKDQVNMFRHFE